MRKRLLLAALCGVAMDVTAQPGANVTATMSINILGKVQTARKINGRWWSKDNRELIRTSDKWRWTISGGNAQHLVRFAHHYPFDPARVNLLDRSMGPNEVRRILGDPNSVFPSDQPEERQMWDYYAANGYKFSVHFSSSGDGIFNATETPDAHAMPKDVQHLAFRFNGKTARDASAERQQRTSRAPRTATSTASSGFTIPSEAPPLKPVNSRKITAEEIAGVTVGMSRGELIQRLGEPHSRMAIAGVEPVKETLRYQRDAGPIISIVLIDGKVAEKPG